MNTATAANIATDRQREYAEILLQGFEREITDETMYLARTLQAAVNAADKMAVKIHSRQAKEWMGMQLGIDNEALVEYDLADLLARREKRIKFLRGVIAKPELSKNRISVLIDALKANNLPAKA